MAITIKPLDKLMDKFQRRASSAGGDYADGVQSPRHPQNASAIAAAKSWADGITAAITNKSFEGGLKKAGEEKWKSRASTVGASRYPQGVSTAGPAWGDSVKPYLDSLTSLTFTTPRGPKGDPGNTQRSTQVQVTLHALKLTRKKG